MLHRIRSGMLALVFVLAPSQVMAQSAVDNVVRMVEGDGYRVVSLSRTLLRRFKISAENQSFDRQVVFTRDGRILWDNLRPRDDEQGVARNSNRTGAGSKNSASADASVTGGVSKGTAGGAPNKVDRARNDTVSNTGAVNNTNKVTTGEPGAVDVSQERPASSEVTNATVEANGSKGRGRDRESNRNKDRGNNGKSDRAHDKNSAKDNSNNGNGRGKRD